MKILSIFLIIFSLLIISCSLNELSGTDNKDEETANLEFSISLTKAPVEIISMAGYLVKSGEDTIKFDFIIQGEKATCKVKDIKPGEWELTVNVYNANYELVYSGSTTVNIKPGEETTVYLNLDPVTGNLNIIVTWGANLADGLVTYYPFNGNADDESENGNDGIVNGATLCEDRYENENHAYFFGGDDYINVKNNPMLEFSGSITISVWAKGLAASTNHTGFSIAGIVGKANCSPYGIGVDDGDRALFQVYSDTTFYRAFKKEIQIEPEQWYHYVGIFESGKYVKLFINGIKVAETLENIPQYFNSSSDDLWIGTRSLSLEPSIPKYFFKGAIDDIRIYNRVLIDSEIKELYTMK